MANVRIKVRPLGSLNGREWPEVGDTLELPDPVAETMAAVGTVEIVTPEPSPAPEVGPKVEKRPAPRKRTETRKADEA